MWYLADGLAARGRKSHNFSFNNTVDNFPLFLLKWRYLVPGYQVT